MGIRPNKIPKMHGEHQRKNSAFNVILITNCFNYFHSTISNRDKVLQIYLTILKISEKTKNNKKKTCLGHTIGMYVPLGVPWYWYNGTMVSVLYMSNVLLSMVLLH